MSNLTLWHNELKYKNWFFFQRNIQYRARLNVPLSVFWHCETFFRKILYSKVSPFNYVLYFAAEWMLKIPKGSPLLTRHGPPVRHFRPTFAFFGYCRREYLTLWSPFTIFEPWIWRRFMPFPACSTRTMEPKWKHSNTTDWYLHKRSWNNFSLKLLRFSLMLEISAINEFCQHSIAQNQCSISVELRQVFQLFLQEFYKLYLYIQYEFI